MADSATLINLTLTFSEGLLPFKASLRKKIQAKMFANEGYINSVNLLKGNN